MGPNKRKRRRTEAANAEDSVLRGRKRRRARAESVVEPPSPPSLPPSSPSPPSPPPLPPPTPPSDEADGAPAGDDVRDEEADAGHAGAGPADDAGHAGDDIRDGGADADHDRDDGGPDADHPRDVRHDVPDGSAVWENLQKGRLPPLEVAWRCEYCKTLFSVNTHFFHSWTNRKGRKVAWCTNCRNSVKYE